ncbi:hypothetical protein GSI_09533 [Ganoderma sinense ZZ0214-1]|uniref:Uncharacterized protein n=1 Tax=Ganoderma sinense ZZ0214-1 TaxID=1077348 RepID=A0A2G8S3N8_9APHY|nr:hypothetical protein GSI_09533 [Ganoderma sinense ZZ0214-1]
MPPAGHGRHSISLGAPRLPEDFLLAPPPGTMALSSMYAPHQYPMSHSSAVYPHDFTSLPPLASALAPSDSSMPPMMPHHHREAMENQDPLARMRAQAELLSRAGVMPNGALTLAQPGSAADASLTLPGLYASSSSQESHYDNRYNLPQSSQWDGSRQFSQAKDFEAPYGQRSQSHPTVPSYSAAGAAGGEPSLQTHPPTIASSSSYDGGNPAPYHHPPLPGPPPMYQHHSSGQGQGPGPGQGQHQHSRSDDMGSEGDFGSDAGSSGTGHSHSIPSSANSSTVHLPLPGFNDLRARADLGGGGGGGGRRGRVSSAFGLMSLDDPNVLAGIASDGQPFFSGISFAPTKQGGNNAHPTSGMALATPMPVPQDLLAQLKSAGGRSVDMDSKEMHDFWKMYLRTPLTGPNPNPHSTSNNSNGNGSSGGGGAMFSLQTPTGPGAPLGQSNVAAGPGGRPSPTRRHSRVASLPSMKTPPAPLFASADEGLGHGHGNGQRPSTGDHEAHGAHQHHHPHQQAGYNSTVRTTVHEADDLKSYEQAVLARKAPMNLNLVPKRKGSLAAPPGMGVRGANAGMGVGMGKSKSMSPVVPHAGFGGAFRRRLASLGPASSSSAGTNGSSGSGMSQSQSQSQSQGQGQAQGQSQASSSLAHAFGGEAGGADGHALLQPPPPPPTMTTEDYATTTGAGAGAGYRPSFKRIASQTLGPASAKRALLGPAGWDHNHNHHHHHQEEDEDDRDVRVVGDVGMCMGGREEEEEDEEEDPDVRMCGVREGGLGRRLAAQVHG